LSQSTCAPDVSVDDIAFLVLETPGDDDEEIPLTYPEALPDLWPLIRPMRVTPSSQRTRMWFAPSIRSARANISRFRFFGNRTRTISSASPFCGLRLLLS